jgi:molecular chaperone Hsp33
VATLLHRLFWQERVRRFAPLQPRFACTCSRERVSGMLEGLGHGEVQDILAEQGRVEVGCEFCGVKYHFDAIDVAGLFTVRAARHPGSTSVN